MVLYSCFRCGYNTKFKSSIINHLNRKNICNPLLDNIDIEDIKIYYGIKTPQNSTIIHKNPQLQTPQFSTISPQFSTISPQFSTISSNNSGNSNVCKYCYNNFSRIDSLKRHLTICKKKKESENIIIKENEVMKKEIEELKKMKCINTQNNITNNTINNTININNYGDEDLSYLKSKDFLQLFGGVYGAIPKLIEKIHFDPEHPENHNIKYTNKKLPYLKIRKDNKWQLVNKKHELLDLIDSKCYMLRERYYKILEKKKYNITEFQKSKIEEFMQKYHEEDKKMTLDLIERTELMLLNNS